MKSNPLAVRLTRRAALLVLCSLALSLRLVAAEGVTIAVTGDIYTPDVKVVSDVILAQQPLDAVLLVGDTCNGKTTTPEKYKETLDGTYDRFRKLIFPCPGNHDGYSKPAFSAYQTYWGERAHAPEMYYSFDLGGWHIVSLDSVNFHDKKGGDKQLTWLKKDLAANKKKPVIAYWHYPYFSRAKHCGDPKMKPLWQALEANGPALVFCGHNHVYERFPALDAEGKTVDGAKGVTEFVIGPGGASPVADEKKDATGPASAKFHGGAQHVGFFTLKSGGAYEFTIKSVAKDGTTAVVESGKGQLQPK